MADTGCVLESKVELALACLAAGATSLCPATLFLPWASERLPPELCAAFAGGALWVLKRDALSNGEGVFFVRGAAEAEAVVAAQRPGSYMTLLGDRDVSDFVLQRHVDAPLLLVRAHMRVWRGRKARRCDVAQLTWLCDDAQEARKFHLRAYVAAWPRTRSGGAPTVALWDGVEVRLAAHPYSGDVTDKLQALTNFAPNKATAGAQAFAIKRMAAEFEAPLADACPAWRSRLEALCANVAALAAGELLPDDSDGTVAAADGAPWLGFALLALDVMLDADGRLWLLEVNRVRS